MPCAYLERQVASARLQTYHARARIVNPHYDGLGTSPLTTRG